MSKAPEFCLYCDKQGNSKAGGSCGFCVGGKPSDTQQDWDQSWGEVLERTRDIVKKCSRCKEPKFTKEFSTNSRSKDGFRSECRACHVLEQQAYYEKNTEHCKKQSWVRALWRKFKITPEDYDRLLDDQNGVCSICSNPPREMRLAVDHDRSCCPGEESCGSCVRGLLHQDCNSRLGWYETNKERISKYLGEG